MVSKKLLEFGECSDFRHSREGGKPVLRVTLGSRLRGNDNVGNREGNSGLFPYMRTGSPSLSYNSRTGANSTNP